MARVLVIDDDEEICALVVMTLVADGHLVYAAMDSREGLDSAIQTTPDLIITDVVMPDMDGWTLVRTLRSRPETAFTPVIFLTAKAEPADRLRGFRLGADDYLPKPFAPEELAYRVRSVIASPLQLDPDQLGESDLKGDLAHIGISTLLVILGSERKSGSLEIRSDHQGCRLWLRNGRIVAGEITQSDVVDPKIVGAEAVYHVLQWGAGAFDFREGNTDGVDDVIDTETMRLLVEGSRRVAQVTDD